MRRVSRYEVYTGIRYKTQWVSSVCIYSIYSVTSTERATWYWCGVAFAWGSLKKFLREISPFAGHWEIPMLKVEELLN